MNDCTRCHGLMVPESFRDIVSETWGWRCVHCGEIMDRIIWRNRTTPPTTLDWEDSDLLTEA